MVTGVVGANWGDEGKGRITDLLSESADFVIRYQGGSNAGHTIINEYGKFALHSIPSGVFRQNTINIIGNGVAVNIRNIISEINNLVSHGVPKPRIYVSQRAQIVMPYHILLDIYEEERLGKDSFGSTRSGIAPFYSDKYAKIGIQISELLGDENSLYKKLSNIIEQKNVLIKYLYHKKILELDTIFEQILQERELIFPYVCNTEEMIYEAIRNDKNIILEGQLGTLRDPDFGIYPMTTSSSTLAGFASVGAGIPPYLITNIVAVVKSYSTAAGAGVFVSEIEGQEADELRNHGGDSGEFGATTGRARRVGWFDVVASRYGCKIQGATEVALTIVDALGYLDNIKICIAYEYHGKRITEFPPTEVLKDCKPIYVTFKGWKKNIRGIKNFYDLPQECQKYIQFIESQIGVKISMVSNGPHRDDIIFMP